MIQYFQQFSSAAAHGKSDLFSSIGIDWKLLLLQSIAFLILLFVLKKFVYPPLVKMLDSHEKKIQEASEAAHAAKKEAEAAQAKVDSMLSEARKEAHEIVANAKDEASAMSSAADKKAKARAERMVESAREDIEKEVASAKKSLHNEALDLVIAATKTVVGKTMTADVDRAVAKEALQEASK